jgi:Flp pilus assembly protein TadG
VELALVVPVMVVLVLMVVQVGQLVRDRVVVVHTAREVARAAAVSATPPTVGEVARRHGLEADALRVVIDPVDAAGFVRVSISYAASTDVVLVGPLLPDVTITAEAHMLAEWQR